jgi:hypothetical protein
MYDVGSGESRQVTGKLGLFEIRASPDYRWVSFSKLAPDGGTFRAFIAGSPFDAAVFPPEHDWIAVTPAEEIAQKAAWSADGAVLYFVSVRDGFTCLWAQRLDRNTKLPLEPAFAVYHSHAARRFLSNVPGLGQNLSVAGNRWHLSWWNRRATSGWPRGTRNSRREVTINAGCRLLGAEVIRSG